MTMLFFRRDIRWWALAVATGAVVGAVTNLLVGPPESVSTLSLLVRFGGLLLAGSLFGFSKPERVWRWAVAIASGSYFLSWYLSSWHFASAPSPPSGDATGSSIHGALDFLGWVITDTLTAIPPVVVAAMPTLLGAATGAWLGRRRASYVNAESKAIERASLMPHPENPSSAETALDGTTQRVLAWGCLVGVVGLMAGAVGPVLFGWGGNQGPLLGFFITGPLGIVVGAIAGAVWSNRQASPGAVGKSIRWLFVLQVLAVLYTLFLTLGLTGIATLSGLVVQALVVLAFGILALGENAWRRWPRSIRIRVWISAGAGAIVILLSLFPPVTQSLSRSSAYGPTSINSTSIPPGRRPRFAFAFDSRLDGSQRPAELGDDRRALLLEIGTLVAAALVLGWVTTRPGQERVKDAS